jgi:hypothetical protein
MNVRYPAMLALCALVLSACQGGFGSGGTAAPGGVAPPVNAQVPATPVPATAKPSPSASSTTPPGNTVSYPITTASSSLKCPQDQGFSCTLQLQLSPSPQPSSSASGSPSASPTPTPTPSPVPSGSASASPSPSPTPAGAHITLQIEGLPKSAPKMNNPDPKAVATVALIALRLHTDTDVTLAGKAIADFTLPKEQLGGRGFAAQLYHEATHKGKTSDTFIGSYANSKIDGTTLHFELPTPPLPIKKDETWLLVLYGDELPSASASPRVSPSASPSLSPSASPSSSTSPSPSPSP